MTELKNWEMRNGKLYRKIEFKNFQEAFDFMIKVAGIAEKINHHPDWMNSYNKVEIELFTHDLGQITHKDYELAQEINNLLKL